MVDAKARERPADPLEDDDHDERLEEEPEDARQESRPLPAAQEERRHENRDGKEIRELREKKERPAHAAVLREGTGDDLRLALKDVERRTIALGDHADENDEERERLFEDVPAVRLRLDDAAHVQGACEHDDAHESEAERQFIRQKLRDGAHRADESILAVRREAAHEERQNRLRRDGEQEEQPDVHIGEDDARIERIEGVNQGRRHEDEDRRQTPDDAVGAVRHDVLLAEELHGVRHGLQESSRPHAVRPEAHLDESADLALAEGEYESRRHDDREKDGDAEKRHDDLGEKSVAERPRQENPQFVDIGIDDARFHHCTP